jgi:chromosome segregation ATPase
VQELRDGMPGPPPSNGLFTDTLAHFERLEEDMGAFGDQLNKWNKEELQRAAAKASTLEADLLASRAAREAADNGWRACAKREENLKRSSKDQAKWILDLEAQVKWLTESEASSDDQLQMLTAGASRYRLCLRPRA